MERIKNFLKNNWQWILFLVILLVGYGYVQVVKENRNDNGVKQEEILGSDSFEYRGKNGIDALSLLKEKAEVEQDNSGMVVSINGREANDENKEFWGFYVDGKMAPIGAAEYETKDNEVINWKIENYF
jgi:hypothetical protein